MSNFSKQFAEHDRAVVVAPAGCGKTELIADAVANCGKAVILEERTMMFAKTSLLSPPKTASSRFSVFCSG